MTILWGSFGGDANHNRVNKKVRETLCLYLMTFHECETKRKILIKATVEVRDF